jgi:hypothetical protein
LNPVTSKQQTDNSIFSFRVINPQNSKAVTLENKENLSTLSQQRPFEHPEHQIEVCQAIKTNIFDLVN